MRRWGPSIVVVALLGATAVAFATTERQKLEKSPFGVLHVDRTVSPKLAAATIELRFGRPHLVTLQIVDEQDRVVAALASEQRVEPGTTRFRWAAKDVRDGIYRPKLTLDTGREFTLQNPIRVDSVAPRAALVWYRPHVLPRRVKPRVLISYRLSEPANVLVYVNGKQQIRGGHTKREDEVEWFARRDGHRLRRGRYRLQLAAVDLAGNIGPRTHAFVVRVR